KTRKTKCPRFWLTHFKRDFVVWMIQQLGVDYYNLQKQHFQQFRALQLIHLYNFSTYQLLKALFPGISMFKVMPELDLIPLKFVSVSDHFWQNKTNQKW